ncbi:VOC family protein [Stigmatella aurantiaca]|uniref:Glyoxalase/Bleomycin resistance protein/dioxygenase domain n=1 Tax=Stigmatella aurantiaca (strain DW4/3-1) TaxID=378806 RepID=Q09CK6_STIAD|nr:VOC family protein [Stigmatella aurantiaca]ADO70019.1 Glyoxalase/Bleomycin resistance protein/dioxygenase domain protein [Stigmatella aurantiaca DW4/3-1]EAU69538.1 glyoxalase/Bleomycin resistance protein/dioxygenase domain [Stigmatella aurantiaca DW4/3-1]
MANHRGDFIWYELLTSNTRAAADFYGAVIGWRSHTPDGMRGYTLFGAGETDVAGLLAIPTEAASAGQRPIWLGYIAVDDVDEAVSSIVAAGGTRHVPPTDIPGVGRFSMVADPQGVMFYVMRGAVDGTSTSFHAEKTGHCQWNELATNDPVAALAFYSGRFGWTKGDAMPMGDMGDYQFFKQNGQMVGAVMARKPGAPPMWTFYFGVDDIDVATKTASSKGAKIHYGPAEIPGGSFIIIADDPQGATFGLVGPRKR